MNPLFQALAALPPMMQADHKRIILEPDPASPETVKLALAFVDRVHKAAVAHHDFATAKGAAGVFAPSQVSNDGHATVYSFAQKPTEPGWLKGSQRHFVPARGQVAYYVGSKSDASKALRAEIDALPAWPRVYEMVEAAGAVQNVKVRSATSYLGGREWDINVGMAHYDNTLRWPAYGFTTGRFFLSMPNFVADIASALDNYNDLELIDPTILQWEPAPGWRLITEAQMKLAFAQADVAKEEAA